MAEAHDADAAATEKGPAAAPHESSTIPQSAALLGYAGAIPFIVCATAVWILGPDATATLIQLQIALGIIILAFTGGVRWGLAMRDPQGPTFAQLFVAAVPGGLTLAVIFLGEPLYQIGFLILAFAWLLWSDISATRRGAAPDWYPGLRIPLTVLVEISLIACLAQIVMTQL